MKAGALINGVFAAQSAVEGTKKTVNEAKAPKINEYDKKLGNPVSTTLDSSGNVVKNASQFIDDLFAEKVAYYDKEREEKKETERKKTQAALAATMGGAAIAHAIVKKNPLAPARAMGSGLKQVGYDLPKILSKKFRAAKIIRDVARSAGKSTKSKAVRIKPSEVNDKIISGLGWGVGAGAGNLAFHMIGEKYFDKDGKNDKVIRRSFKSAIPEPTVELYDKYQDQQHRQYRRPDHYSPDNRRRHSNGYYAKRDNRYYNSHKEAAELLDQLYVEKVAASTGEFKNTAKKLFHEDVLQNSIKSLPYYLMPLGVGYAVNKDLRSDGRPLRGKKAKSGKIVIEVPTESLDKSAAVIYGPKEGEILKEVADKAAEGAKKFDVKDSWRKFGKEGLPSSILKSLTWAAPITALTAITGRNLRGRGEKMNDKAEPGKTRITIETNPAYKNRDDTFINASEALDEMVKEAADDIKKKNPRLKTRVNQFLKAKGLMKMENLNVLQAIMRAAMQHHTVNITYRDTKGVVTTRETEPYEVKNGKYWGYDVAKQAIRQFNLENLSSATETRNVYTPRWPVKIS